MAEPPRPDASDPRGKRFISTTVETEGRVETKVVEVPAFDVAPWDTDAELSHVGQRTPRADAPEKTTGRARFTTDLKRAGMLHVALLRASIPKGTVTRIDQSAARRVPGVLDIITAEDIRAARLTAGAAKLLDPVVLYAGHVIAAVCADTLHAATQGVAALVVEMDAQPAVIGAEAALQADGPRTRGGANNLALKSPVIRSRGDIDAGLAAADVTVSITVRTPVALHSALEPHGAVAEWEGDRLTVYEGTQGIFRVRENLAKAFQLPLTHVRVVCDYMGGGFGAKNYAGTHTYIAALFAKRLGAPVQCILDRAGEQTDTGNRPATEQHVTLGATRDGRLTAISCDATIPLGIVGWEGGPGQIYHQMHSCPNVRTRETFVFTNTAGMNAFRGPGFTEGAFGLERAMDLLARKLGIDALELRRRNYAARDEQKDRPWSGNQLLECYEQGARAFGWGAPVEVLPADPFGARVVRGVGVAAQTWSTGGGPPAYAMVRLNPDGTADVLSGTQDLGTGIRTIMQQVAAEALGYPLANVRAIIGDTERTPYTGNSWGSQTTPSVTPAVRMAAEDAKRQLFEAAAELLGGVTPSQLAIADGVITVPDGEQRITAAEVGAKLGNVTMIGKGSRGPNPAGMAIHTCGVQFAEVEVDLDTGVVRVLRIVAAHDAGRIVNPMLAEGQMQGGILQGLGYAMFEERAMDARLGVALNVGLHDYKIPTMADVPEITVLFVDGSDTLANHVGARGIAEAPIIPTGAAIANAVAMAIGAEPDALPLTPWRVLGWLA